jgi:hypothetical protein
MCRVRASAYCAFLRGAWSFAFRRSRSNTQLSRDAARQCDYTSYENSVIPKYRESFCLFCARRVRHAAERSQRGK